ARSQRDERVAQLGVGVERQRIQALGPVEPDRADAVLLGPAEVPRVHRTRIMTRRTEGRKQTDRGGAESAELRGGEQGAGTENILVLWSSATCAPPRSPRLSSCSSADRRDRLDLDERVPLEQVGDLHERHRRVVRADELAPERAERARAREVRLLV